MSGTKDLRLAGIREAWGRYLVLLVGVGLVFLVATIVVWPWPYAVVVEHLILPDYEATFGFRGGRLPVSMGETNHTLYGLLVVVPGGRLARAGAKSGDIPVEYHGGIWAFWGALEEARAGREGQFDVLARSDWPDWDKRRKVVITPEPAVQPGVQAQERAVQQ